MAKKNTVHIEESLHEGDILEIIPQPVDQISVLIKQYKEKGWDDNRIAARLMVSVDKVKQVK